GDSSSPFSSEGYAPLDERPGKQYYSLDAQRSAANTNDLKGKILRIRPQPDGTYTIPEGNLFAPGTPKTRPEIYVMGCRNPYRIAVNKKTGTVYWVTMVQMRVQRAKGAQEVMMSLTKPKKQGIMDGLIL